MVEGDVRERLEKIPAQMRKDYSEALRDSSIHVGQDHALKSYYPKAINRMN